MNPHPVVEDFDVVEQLVTRFLSRGEVFVMHQLIFQNAEETFADRVIPAVPLAAHALRATSCHELFSERRACILTAAITMHERRDRPASSALPLDEGRFDELS